MSCSQTLAQQNTAMKAALVTLQKKLKGLDTQTSELSQEKDSLRSKVREESRISRVGEIDGAEHTLWVPSGENSWRSCFEASSTGARKTSPACQLPGTSTGADNSYTVGLTHKNVTDTCIAIVYPILCHPKMLLPVCQYLNVFQCMQSVAAGDP